MGEHEPHANKSGMHHQSRGVVSRKRGHVGPHSVMMVGYWHKRPGQDRLVESIPVYLRPQNVCHGSIAA